MMVYAVVCARVCVRACVCNVRVGSAVANGDNQLSMASVAVGCPWRLHMSPDDAVFL